MTYLMVGSSEVVLNADTPYPLSVALYGYRRSPRLWQQFFTRVILSAGFQQSRVDPTLFFDLTAHVMLVIYVDDMFLTGLRGDAARSKRTLASVSS